MQLPSSRKGHFGQTNSLVVIYAVLTIYFAKFHKPLGPVVCVYIETRKKSNFKIIFDVDFSKEPRYW